MPSRSRGSSPSPGTTVHPPLTPPSVQGLTIFLSAARAIHGFRSFAEWLERTPVIATLPSSRPPSPEKSAGPATIEIENLNFSYPSRPGKPAISDLTLTIRAGEKIAFCGPSGGGKSSILACLARFYDPNSGRILVNGRDVRSIALEDHWGSIAMVAQDATLYAGTVRLWPSSALPH